MCVFCLPFSCVAICERHAVHMWFFNHCDWTMVIMPYVAVPYLQKMGPNATLQQDNARPQTPRAVITFLHQSNVGVLDWPACLLDLR